MIREPFSMSNRVALVEQLARDLRDAVAECERAIRQAREPYQVARRMFIEADGDAGASVADGDLGPSIDAALASYTSAANEALRRLEAREAELLERYRYDAAATPVELLGFVSDEERAAWNAAGIVSHGSPTINDDDLCDE